ncbi:transcriptional regulator [Streptomyces davaonensis JCM 4913]|uniref:Transcriptional regulator n=1 Tax=Streptomyces davaonensis (strain DSM 101723 / JCM 4913 / KCC S-0913 / 768) TaxID=1214101 RepID=K4R553_STRDJ|nr:transcriptional regulator [Streptomyces davaonensis JCM 4913]
MGGVKRCELRFGLLGPPILYDCGSDGTVVRPVGSPKVRLLLAALLLEAGRTVSVEALKDALWGGAPPASAHASLHNHVTRLRRLLDDPSRLRAVSPGYLLRVDDGELDIHAFDAHTAAARAAHADRDWCRTLGECAAALALWRGTPLSGLPAELGGYALVQRLKEARLLLLEWRYDAELAVADGRLDALLPELAALAAEHPLREAYHRQLMLALHRSGRQAEALAVHRDLRHRLLEELGVEPGPAVRGAHLEVLRGGGEATGDDKSGAGGDRPAPATPAPTTTPQASPPRPAQLPPPPAHFTGRAPLTETLHRTLTTPGPTVAVLTGMAGIGKSALALHVAHALTDRFPDGQLYVNLHGATPGMLPLTSAQALAALLRDVGADPRAVPEHPDAAAALLRSMLAPTRTLLVLDDAANAAQVRSLLPAGPGCAVIITSRSSLAALDGVRRFPLAPLSDEDSAALLRAVSGRDDGIDAGHPLVELTGRLPLALRVVAARLAARRALTPDVLAGQLTATDRRLHHLEYDDLSVRRSLAVAHDALAASDREADRDAALVLRRIGALDLPEYGAPLLARLSGTGVRRAEDALDRLVDVALLEETALGRYVPHDLVRDFARELAGTAGGTAVAESALSWYAALAERTLTAIVEPGLDQDDRRRPTSCQPSEHAAHVADTHPFDGPEAAFAWGDAELENIAALAERYADASDHRIAARLCTLLRLLFPYVQRSGRVAEMEVLGRAALRVARRLGDEAAEAYALGDLAGVHFLAGRHTEALTLNDEALTIWERLGVLSWMRRSLNNRGLLLEGLGRYEESGRALRQSLAYSRQLNDPYGEAVTHQHLGNLFEHTDPRAAIEQHRLSLAIGEMIGNVLIQLYARCNIGYAHLTLGEPAAAARHFEESLRDLVDQGDWHGESQTRLGLVRSLRLSGRAERADQECAELLRRADARADRYIGGLARHQHGLLLSGSGRTEEARTSWRAALDALTGTDEKAVVAELMTLLADDGRPPSPTHFASA